jgi:hypothetical protein
MCFIVHVFEAYQYWYIEQGKITNCITTKGYGYITISLSNCFLWVNCQLLIAIQVGYNNTTICSFLINPLIMMR